MDEWEAMDEWCQKQAAKISAVNGAYIMGGGSLSAPRYRTLLGKHQAFMQMRSFISGSKKAKPHD